MCLCAPACRAKSRRTAEESRTTSIVLANAMFGGSWLHSMMLLEKLDWSYVSFIISWYLNAMFIPGPVQVFLIRDILQYFDATMFGQGSCCTFVCVLRILSSFCSHTVDAYSTECPTMNVSDVHFIQSSRLHQGSLVSFLLPIP